MIAGPGSPHFGPKAVFLTVQSRNNARTLCPEGMNRVASDSLTKSKPNKMTSLTAFYSDLTQNGMQFELTFC